MTNGNGIAIDSATGSSDANAALQGQPVSPRSKGEAAVRTDRNHFFNKIRSHLLGEYRFPEKVDAVASIVMAVVTSLRSATQSCQTRWILIVASSRTVLLSFLRIIRWSCPPSFSVARVTSFSTTLASSSSSSVSSSSSSYRV